MKTIERNRIARLALPLCLCLLCAVSPAGEAKTRNVYLILKNLINPFCVRVQNGALQAAKDLDVNLTVLTPLQADNTEELTQLTEQAVASGECDVLIMFTADSVGIIPAVQAVRDAGIPVVVLNTALYTDDVIWETIVNCDNFELGRIIGEAQAERMNRKGKVLVLEGVAGAQITVDRIGGIREAIAKYPEMKIVASQPANMNRALGMEVTQNMLQSFPDLDGVVTMTDEMALGAIEAIEAAGRSGKLVVGSAGADPDGIQAIIDGKLAFTVDVSAFPQGYEAVRAASRILAGEKLPPRIPVAMKVYDITNAKELHGVDPLSY